MYEFLIILMSSIFFLTIFGIIKYGINAIFVYIFLFSFTFGIYLVVALIEEKRRK